MNGVVSQNYSLRLRQLPVGGHVLLLGISDLGFAIHQEPRIEIIDKGKKTSRAKKNDDIFKLPEYDFWGNR